MISPKLQVYQTIFDKMYMIGIIPWRLDTTNLKDAPVKGGFSRIFSFANFLFMCILVLKQAFLVFHTFISNDDLAMPKVQMALVFRLTFLFGCITLWAVAYNHTFYGSEIIGVVKKWLLLESEFTDVQDPVLKMKLQKWIKHRNIQFQLSSLSCIGNIFALPLVSLLFPRLPNFLYSLAPTSLDNDSSFGVLLGRGLLILCETYVVPTGWANLLAFDLIICAISTHLAIYLEHFSTTGYWETKDDGIRVYKSFQIIIILLNKSYSNSLVVHMAAMSVTILLALFGAIHNNGSVAISMFLFPNILFLLFRMIYVLIPLAGLDRKSEKMKNALSKFGESEESGKNEKEVYVRELHTLRKFCVSSGGIYKIDYDCLSNFIEFLISYSLAIIQLN